MTKLEIGVLSYITGWTMGVSIYIIKIRWWAWTLRRNQDKRAFVKRKV